MRHYHYTNAPYAKLTPVPGGLAFESTYDQSLIADLKLKIPPHARRWDGNNKVWIVDAQYARVCAELADVYLGVRVDVPKQAGLPATIETRLVRLEYLGRCKDRGNGESTAFGWADGGWTLIFSESVLRKWFEATPQRPGEKPTYYAILSVKNTATIEEIRSAYRRLARQWHPDVCHEPDAAQQFKIIQNAYEILSDPVKRKKFDAGLLLQSTIRSSHRERSVSTVGEGYRSPLRCGWLLVTGKQALGRFVVEKISVWQDVVRGDGKILVTSWEPGAKHFSEAWV